MAPANAGNHCFMDFGNTAVKQADCGPERSSPETGLSGDVPAADRDSGRSERGYNCNMTLLEQGAGRRRRIVSANYDHCSYTGSMISTAITKKNTGVQVVDVKDPRNPRIVRKLTAPGMLSGTWETLQGQQEAQAARRHRNTAAVGRWLLRRLPDISDCAHPKSLLNTGPGTHHTASVHLARGRVLPDGRRTGRRACSPHLSAIDISGPRRPKVIWQGLHSFVGHGFRHLPDGNRMYLSNMAGITRPRHLGRAAPRSRTRVPHRRMPLARRADQSAHHSRLLRRSRLRHHHRRGPPGRVKIFDVEQVRSRNSPPRSNSRSICRPTSTPTCARRWAVRSSATTPTTARPTIENPTALACGWESSGIRVFDIADLKKITEIGYLNPPTYRSTNPFSLPNSPHALGRSSVCPIEFMPTGHADDQRQRYACTRRSAHGPG